MKLSEAIRRGSENTAQSYAAYFDYCGDNLVGCCALGAAFIGEGHSTNGSIDVTDYFYERFKGGVIEHPVIGGVHDTREVIISLNDTHQWSRERIANWLEEQGL